MLWLTRAGSASAVSPVLESAAEEVDFGHHGPRSRMQERFARHRRQRLDQPRRAQLGDGFELLRVETAPQFHLHHLLLLGPGLVVPRMNSATSGPIAIARGGVAHRYAFLPLARGMMRTSPAAFRRFSTV